MALYLLVKRKNSKSWQINNLKPGITKQKVRSTLSKERKPGFMFKLVNEKELAKFLLKNKPKGGN